jgi:small-conductance mechanosensitive channel
VTNDKVFEEPVYNYTREFPFIWEEIKIPIPYSADRRRAESIMLDCTRELVNPIEKVSAPVRRDMERKYFIDFETLTPKVYYRLTDNWLELSLRFVVTPHGVRNLKDELSRMLLDRFEAAHISIASATYDVVGFPPIRLEGRVAERIASAIERSDAAAQLSGRHGDDRENAVGMSRRVDQSEKH